MTGFYIPLHGSGTGMCVPGNSFLSFPIFYCPPQKQAGNGIGSKLHQPAFHLREVLAGGHNVVHKEHIASLKIDGMEYEVGEFVEAVSAFHLLTVFPYPSGTKAVGDFQAARKEAAKPGETGGGSTNVNSGSWAGTKDVPATTGDGKPTGSDDPDSV